MQSLSLSFSWNPSVPWNCSQIRPLISHWTFIKREWDGWKRALARVRDRLRKDRARGTQTQNRCRGIVIRRRKELATVSIRERREKRRKKFLYFFVIWVALWLSRDCRSLAVRHVPAARARVLTLRLLAWLGRSRIHFDVGRIAFHQLVFLICFFFFSPTFPLMKIRLR